MFDPCTIWTEFCALVAEDQGLDEVPTQWTRDSLFIGGLVGEKGEVLEINWTDFLSLEFAARRKWGINLRERKWQALMQEGALAKLTLGNLYDEVIEALTALTPAESA